MRGGLESTRVTTVNSHTASLEPPATDQLTALLPSQTFSGIVVH